MDFLIISRGIEVNQLAKILLILEMKFGEDPLGATILAITTFSPVFFHQ